MGRGSADSGNVLFGKALPRRRKAVEVAISSPERDFWLVGDAATWYPSWTGPVDVVLTKVDEGRGIAEARIVTPDIEETGATWEVQLTELEPRESPLAPADPNDPDDKRFEVGEQVIWHSVDGPILCEVLHTREQRDFAVVEVLPREHEQHGESLAIGVEHLTKA